jgi:hypothetical protein
VDHRAGQGARDPINGLDPGHDQSPQGVDATGLGADDDVIGPGQRLSLLHTVDLCGCTGDLPCLADLGVDNSTFAVSVAGPNTARGRVTWG